MKNQIVIKMISIKSNGLKPQFVTYTTQVLAQNPFSRPVEIG